jgi:hypothetical protein
MSCGWKTFIPVLELKGQRLDSSVWIEINYPVVEPRLKLNQELERLMREEREERRGNIGVRNLLPCVEAAHIDRIPCSAFLRAFSVGRADKKIHPLSLSATE